MTQSEALQLNCRGQTCVMQVTCTDARESLLILALRASLSSTDLWFSVGSHTKRAISSNRPWTPSVDRDLFKSPSFRICKSRPSPVTMTSMWGRIGKPGGGSQNSFGARATKDHGRLSTLLSFMLRLTRRIIEIFLSPAELSENQRPLSLSSRWKMFFPYRTGMPSSYIDLHVSSISRSTRPSMSWS